MAGQRVVAALADQDVVAASPAVQNVVARVADEHVVAAGAGHVLDVEDATRCGGGSRCQVDQYAQGTAGVGKSVDAAATIQRSGHARSVGRDAKGIGTRPAHKTFDSGEGQRIRHPRHAAAVDAGDGPDVVSVVQGQRVASAVAREAARGHGGDWNARVGAVDGDVAAGRGVDADTSPCRAAREQDVAAAVEKGVGDRRRAAVFQAFEVQHKPPIVRVLKVKLPNFLNVVHFQVVKFPNHPSRVILKPDSLLICKLTILCQFANSLCRKIEGF